MILTLDKPPDSNPSTFACENKKGTELRQVKLEKM